MRRNECLDVEWSRYLHYVKMWADDHVDDWYKGQSPLTYPEWYEAQKRIYGENKTEIS